MMFLIAIRGEVWTLFASSLHGWLKSSRQDCSSDWHLAARTGGIDHSRSNLPYLPETAQCSLKPCAKVRREATRIRTTERAAIAIEAYDWVIVAHFVFRWSVSENGKRRCKLVSLLRNGGNMIWRRLWRFIEQRRAKKICDRTDSRK